MVFTSTDTGISMMWQVTFRKKESYYLIDTGHRLILIVMPTNLVESVNDSYVSLVSCAFSV